MTYADGEKVSYTYNAGGLLHSMSGEKGNSVYNYVKQLGYDKFEQRVFLHYGNGTKTTYNYEEDRRRLKHMSANTAAKRSFMDNEYTYDKVNNILSLKNSAPVPSSNLMGGASEYTYEYDDLYRLTEAKGHYTGPNEQHRYTLQMSYNSVGSILEKTQLHQRSSSGTSWQEQKKTTYQQAYVYSQEQPHAAVHIGGQTYSYDSNGNQTGWTDDKSGQRRKIFWDEENRIRAIMDNGATFHYVYDAQGQRVLKGHSSGQNLYVNASQKAGSGNMSNYTVYVNPYLVLRSGGYTKHYYIESQRIVSKLGSGWDDSGKGPLETNKAGEGQVNYENKHLQLGDAIVKNLKFLGQDGAILTAGKSGKVPPGQLNTKDKGGGGSEPPSTSTVESFQYYYHPDHLGSTSYITDASGEVYQHLEYFAFGETFVEEHSNTNRTPFLYNGKELDDETGLYYYGARYYDARTSIWASVDPLAEKYPNASPFIYCANNPVNLIDPDGRSWTDPDGNVIEGEALKNVKVYIFHDNDFKEQALIQYQDAVKKYGEGSVALSNTGTTKGFSEDWGNMDGDVKEVMIMTHGKNQSIKPGEGQQFTATGDGKTNISGAAAPNVQDLPQPKGNITQAALLMYSCHSADTAPKAHGEGDHRQGDLKGSKQPIAEVFARTFPFVSVTGTIGSVNYNSFWTNGTLPSSSSYMRPYPQDGRWKVYVSPKQ
jgi:RHS repeat-associated protein